MRFCDWKAAALTLSLLLPIACSFLNIRTDYEQISEGVDSNYEIKSSYIDDLHSSLTIKHRVRLYRIETERQLNAIIKEKFSQDLVYFENRKRCNLEFCKYFLLVEYQYPYKNPDFDFSYASINDKTMEKYAEYIFEYYVRNSKYGRKTYFLDKEQAKELKQYDELQYNFPFETGFIRTKRYILTVDKQKLSTSAMVIFLKKENIKFLLQDL